MTTRWKTSGWRWLGASKDELWFSREELRDALTAINRTARALAFDTPGLEDKFRLPRSGTDQALLNAARAFAADATPLSAAFIRHEMPANFLTELQTQIEAFESAINHQATAKGVRVSSTAGIDASLTRAITAVRRLDAVIQNKFRNDATTLAAWATASHTERTNRSSLAAAARQPLQRTSLSHTRA